ncbi:MAG TPA: serine hydrolase [Candidatus Binataceae bacterium]
MRSLIAAMTAVLFVAICGSASAQEIGPHFDLQQYLATDRAFRIGAFRHMDNIFQHRVIRRGGSVNEIPRAERNLNITYQWKGKKHRLDDILGRTNTTGLLVIKDGKIVFEKYYLGASEKSRFTSMSVAKSFTSTLVGVAIAEGKISGIDAPVSDYLPELKGSGYDGVPIKDILQMSSGVKFTEDYGGTDDMTLMWRTCMENNAQSLENYARSLHRQEEPGKRFEYRSIDTEVLGWLVNRVTGEHPADYLSRKIWQPLGMEQDATWLTDGSGMEATFCCIQATLRDFGRFGLLFLNHGKWKGEQIVPARWVDEATTPGSPQVQPGKLIPNYPLGYQYQWWTFPGPQGHPYSAVGIYFQYIYVDPREKLVIVKTSANDGPWDIQKEPEIYAAFDAITSAVKDK